MFPPDVVPPGVSDPSKTWVDEKEDGTDEENALLPIEWVLKFYEKHINDPNSKMVECVQHAGEMIFVPTGWWHMVINLVRFLLVELNCQAGLRFA
jgi:hypothetical protein